MEKINIIGYLLFALLVCTTPGPNNILLFTLGKTIGYRKTIPVILGILAGIMILLTISGYGLAVITMEYPALRIVFKIAAALWFVYLAFKLRKLSITPAGTEKTKIGFFTAVFLQFINPKAWIMAVNGAAAFLPKFSGIHLNVFLFDVLFLPAGIFSTAVWTLGGDFLSRVITSEKHNKIAGNVLFVVMLIMVATLFIG